MNSHKNSTSNSRVQVEDYAAFIEKKEQVRQSLLNSPNRFQAISAREDRSDTCFESFKARTLGKFLLHHRGCIVMKGDDDQAIYKELLAHVRPATVIELGSLTGGSAVWIADILRLEGVECSVYSMDINLDIIEERVKEIKPQNVTFLQGDSNKISETFTPEFLKDLPHPWIVIDDAHENTFGVLEFFLGHMKMGDYFVVEDTNPNSPQHLGAGRIHPEHIPVGTKLLDTLKRFLTEHKEQCAVDSYFTDLFGYNGTSNWHGYIRIM